MDFLKRHLHASFTLLMGFIATTTIIIDGPSAVEKLTRNGPVWMSHPNFWWILTCIAIWGVGLYVIFRNERSHAHHDEFAKHRHLAQHVQHVLDVLRHTHGEKNLLAILNNEIGVTTPDFLLRRFGKEERDKFAEAMTKAKKLTPGNVHAISLAYVGYLASFVLSDAESIVERKRKVVDDLENEVRRQSSNSLEELKQQNKPAESTPRAAGD